MVCSELVIAETLIRPMREGNAKLETAYRAEFAAPELDPVPATRELWHDTARLRAETGLKTPDALHPLAALRSGCALFVTNDTDFHRVQDLPVVVLDDLLEEARKAWRFPTFTNCLILDHIVANILQVIKHGFLPS